MVLPLYLQRRLEVKKEVIKEVMKEEVKEVVNKNVVKNVVKKVVKKIDFYKNIPEEDDFEEPTIIYKNLSSFFLKK